DHAAAPFRREARLVPDRWAYRALRRAPDADGSLHRRRAPDAELERTGERHPLPRPPRDHARPGHRRGLHPAGAGQYDPDPQVRLGGAGDPVGRSGSAGSVAAARGATLARARRGGWGEIWGSARPTARRVIVAGAVTPLFFVVRAIAAHLLATDGEAEFSGIH